MANQTVTVIDVVAQVTDDTAAGARSATSTLEKFEAKIKKIQAEADKLKKMNKVELTLYAIDKASKTIDGVIGFGKKIAGKVWEATLKVKDTASKIIKGTWDLGKNIAGKTWNVTLKAVDLVTAPVRGIVNLLKNPVLQMAGIAGISLGAADTINTYKDFESEMANLHAITGATTDEMQKMEDGIRKVASNSNKSVIEIAANAKMVAESGGDINLMLAQLTHGVNLATATQTDMATTLDFLGSAMKTFGIEAEDTQSVADSLAYTTRLANVELSQLRESYVNVGGSAAHAGLNIHDVNAALITLSNAGMKGGAAGTSLNAIIRNLSTPTDKAAKSIESLGISLYDVSGQSRDMFDIMSDLEKKLGGMSDQKRNNYLNDIFDEVAKGGWDYLFADGISSIRELSKELSEAGNDFGGLGTSAGMAEGQLDTVSGAFSLLQRAADEFKISIGKKAEPYIKQFASWLTGKIPKATEYAVKAFDWVEQKIKDAHKAIKNLTDNSKWKNADLFGKIGVAWDELIKKPFDKWWNSNGKSWLLQKGGEIGGFLENALISGVKGLFGEKAAQNISDALDWIKRKAGEATGAIDSLMNSPEWQNADSIWDKIKLSWSKLVAEPFAEWWDGGGREYIYDKTTSVGDFLGKGITSGLLAILGFDGGEAVTDGVGIGKSFIDGFMEGFDADKVGTAMKTAFDNAFKWVKEQIPKVLKAIFSNPVTAGIAITFIGDIVLKGIKKASEAKDMLDRLFPKKDTGGQSNGLEDILKQNTDAISTQMMNVTAGTVIINGATQQGMPPNINNTPTTPPALNGSGNTPSLSGNPSSTPLLPSGRNNGTQEIIETKFANPNASGGGAAAGGGTLTASTLLKSIPLVAEVLANLFIPSSSAQWKMESGSKAVQDINNIYKSQLGVSSNLPTAYQEKLEKMDFDTLYSGMLEANEKGDLPKYMKKVFKDFDITTEKAILDYMFGDNKGFNFTDIENTGFIIDNRQKKINESLGNLLENLTSTPEIVTSHNNLDEIKNQWCELPVWYESNVWNPLKRDAEESVKYLNQQFGNVPEEIKTIYAIEFDLKNPEIIDKTEKFISGNKDYYKFDGNYPTQNKLTDSLFSSNSDKTNSIIQSALEPKANGDIVTRPMRALIGEDGAEAIIPLSGKRRNRGLALWEKAGEMLGVKPYAEGAITNATPAVDSDSAGGSGYGYVSVPVTVDNVTFEVNVDGDSMSADDIVKIMKANIANLTDEIAFRIATSVQQAFANMPLESEG